MAAPQQQRTDSASEMRDLTGSCVGRFQIRKRLGQGGMGEVYLAEDTKLKRPVALKRIAPALGDNPRYRERFLKEAERASSLNNPHIAAIYDVLEEAGQLFVVMEFVEGVTLREQLKEGVLSIPQFVDIATQCCRALGAAHEKGILHRDIKPENIMLTPGGHLKVLDFGVARRMMQPSGKQTSTADAADDNSTVGGISGTPAYMAPEVLLEKDADGRADLFSLGVVFYEALSGTHPFRTTGFMETCDRLLHHYPAPIHTLRPELPPYVDPVISQLLAKDPEARTSSTEELISHLQAIEAGMAPHVVVRSKRRAPVWGRVAIGVTIAILLALAFPTLLNRTPAPLPVAPGATHLAVLPFRVIGGDAKDQAFAAGLMESVTAKLTQLTSRKSLQVAPSRAVLEGQIASIEAAHVGLGVNLVLEGAVMRTGENIQVNYSLVDVLTRRNVNAESFVVPAADSLRMEDQIVGGVVRMLALQLVPAERMQLAQRETQAASAHDFYLQGRGYLQDYDRPENLDNAVRVFQKALQVDANYALAHTGLGEAFWRRYETTRDAEWIRKARQSCARAVQLNARLPSARTCLGTLYTGTGKYEDAAREFERAAALEPTSDEAHRGLARAYELLARPKLAEEAHRQAIRLRSHYWAGYTWLGSFLARQARYEEAIAQFQQASALAPDNANAYRSLGGLYYYLGRYPEAIQSLEKSIQLRPDAVAYSNLGYNLFGSRKYEDAIRAFEKARALSPRDFIIVGNLARAYSSLPNHREKAMEIYRQAMQLAEQSLAVNPRDADAQIMLSVYCAATDDREKSLQYLEAALRNRPDNPEFAFQAGLAHILLGQTDKSLAWLQRAVRSGHSPAEIRTAPEFDSLQHHPQFKKLLASQQ